MTTAQNRTGSRHGVGTYARGGARKRTFECPPDHRHGESSTCYNQHGCGCADCRAYMAALEWRRKKYAKEGKRTPGVKATVPIVEVRAHLRKLSGAGIGRRRVAEITGVSMTTLASLYTDTVPPSRHPKKNVLRSTAEKIYAVQPTRENLADAQVVPARTAQRRIQALYAIGFNALQIAERAKLSASNEVPRILSASRITKRVDEQIAEAYDAMSMKPPTPSNRYEKAAITRAKNLARERGWHPPLAWDDIALQEEPPAVTADSSAQAAIAAAREKIESGERIANLGGLFQAARDCGMPTREIAEELGVGFSTVTAALTEYRKSVS